MGKLKLLYINKDEVVVSKSNEGIRNIKNIKLKDLDKYIQLSGSDDILYISGDIESKKYLKELKTKYQDKERILIIHRHEAFFYYFLEEIWRKLKKELIDIKNNINILVIEKKENNIMMSIVNIENNIDELKIQILSDALFDASKFTGSMGYRLASMMEDICKNTRELSYSLISKIIYIGDITISEEERICELVGARNLIKIKQFQVSKGMYVKYKLEKNIISMPFRKDFITYLGTDILFTQLIGDREEELYRLNNSEILPIDEKINFKTKQSGQKNISIKMKTQDNNLIEEINIRNPFIYIGDLITLSINISGDLKYELVIESKNTSINRKGDIQI